MATADHVLVPARRAAWVTPTVITLMVVLRLVVLGMAAWLLDPRPAWLSPVYETGTYLMTLFLIWWERDHLSEFHIGWLAVGIILVFKPVETLFLMMTDFTRSFPMALPGPYALFTWALALGAAAWLAVARPALRKITRAERRWFGWGVVTGIATAALISVPMAAQLKLSDQITAESPRLLPLVIVGVRDFFYQLGYAAVSEEPLFRGFLWGCLLRSGWKDRWIWLFQAGLFMLSHIYYVSRVPYSFWIIVPAGALVLGWLAWRSRSIATSMAAHAALNALGMPLGQVVAFWFFR